MWKGGKLSQGALISILMIVGGYNMFSGLVGGILGSLSMIPQILAFCVFAFRFSIFKNS
jgi:hypothetical protein